MSFLRSRIYQHRKETTIFNSLEKTLQLITSHLKQLIRYYCKIRWE